MRNRIRHITGKRNQGWSFSYASTLHSNRIKILSKLKKLWRATPRDMSLINMEKRNLEQIDSAISKYSAKVKSRQEKEILFNKSREAYKKRLDDLVSTK